MRRDLPYYELPEEVRVVVEDSPKLECCEEFRDASIFAFALRAVHGVRPANEPRTARDGAAGRNQEEKCAMKVARGRAPRSSSVGIEERFLASLGMTAAKVGVAIFS